MWFHVFFNGRCPKNPFGQYLWNKGSSFYGPFPDQAIATDKELRLFMGKNGL